MNELLKLWKYFSASGFQSGNTKKQTVKTRLYDNTDKNTGYIQAKFDGSADLTVRNLSVNEKRCAVVTIEGMCDKETLSLSVISPLLKSFYPDKTEKLELLGYIEKYVLSASDISRTDNFEDLLQMIMSGFAVLIIEGCSTAICIGVQGYSFRSVTEPESEVSERGSREGFVEPLHINMSLLRRRIKNPKLKMETMILGELSKG